MKIRIVSITPLPAEYGLTVGSVHIARSNWKAGSEPKFFVDIRFGNDTFPVGILSSEAVELLDCEHQVTSCAMVDGVMRCSECGAFIVNVPRAM